MKLRRILLLCLALLLIGNAVVGYRAYSKDAKAADTEKVFDDLAIMMQVLQLIRTNYVDAGEVTSDQLLTEIRQGREAPLSPDALQESDTDIQPVYLLVETENMRFDRADLG